MDQSIRYYSTNRSVPAVDLRGALLQGQAGDQGLFLPERFPALNAAELRELAGRPYPAVAHAVLRKYTAGTFDDATLQALCDDAYNFDVPLEPVTRRRYLLRLDRGPTASFKDFAARLMARWMGVLMQQEPGELVILTATSGDTGSAVAHAYHGVPRVQVVVLFPPAEVSDRQRKQMTTIGGNVTPIAVDGKFDDCQALVKRAFADRELARIRLTSANSINIGRLLPQAVYYVYAYVNLVGQAESSPSDAKPSSLLKKAPDSCGTGLLTGPETGQETRPTFFQRAASPLAPIVICVPSGNFGNMMGAVIAARMGMPLERLVIATNANDEFPNFLRSGRYQRISPSRVCISNAMNVGHPSNLARLIDVYGGWMDETGMIRVQPDLERLRRDLYAISLSDEETRITIKNAYERHGVILEPHGAVGWAGLERFWQAHPECADRLTVSVETAHPAKFPEEIRATIGVEPEVPPSLAGLEQRREHYETMPAAYELFRAFLVARFG